VTALCAGPTLGPASLHAVRLSRRLATPHRRPQGDEPTDLPEGKLVALVPLDEVFLGGGDDR
jgi:hypothetical protein